VTYRPGEGGGRRLEKCQKNSRIFLCPLTTHPLDALKDTARLLFIVDSRNFAARMSQKRTSPIPVPMVKILPLKLTDRIPQPLLRLGIFLIACNVRASRRSVFAFDPTAYMTESSSTERQTFSVVCGSFFDINCLNLEQLMINFNTLRTKSIDLYEANPLLHLTHIFFSS